MGALFGVSSFVLAELLVVAGRKVRITLIDPLDGYYGPKTPDIITGLPVTLTTVEVNRNIFLNRVSNSSVSIVKALSSETAAYASIENGVDILIIDGDHSYEGVKFDGDNLTNALNPGGIVIFDDYGAKSWPDVERYVSNEFVKKTEFSHLFFGSDTAVFFKK